MSLRFLLLTAFILASLSGAQALELEYCLRVIRGSALELPEQWARAKRILNRYFEARPERILGAMSSEDMQVLARHFGVKLMPDILKLKPYQQRSYLRQALAEIMKAPRLVLETIEQDGRSLDLVMGNVTNHPEAMHLKGKMVTTYKNPKPYEFVPGISIRNSIVAADKIYDTGKTGTHGSENIVLHEEGHTFEKALQGRSKSGKEFPLSHDGEFLELHRTEEWDEKTEWYEKNFPEEAWAEKFAEYFDSSFTREILLKKHPRIHDYFRSRFDPAALPVLAALPTEALPALKKARINPKGDSKFLEAHRKTRWDFENEWHLFVSPEQAFAHCYERYFKSAEENVQLRKDLPPLWQYFRDHVETAVLGPDKPLDIPRAEVEAALKEMIAIGKKAQDEEGRTTAKIIEADLGSFRKIEPISFSGKTPIERGTLKSGAWVAVRLSPEKSGGNDEVYFGQYFEPRVPKQRLESFYVFNDEGESLAKLPWKRVKGIYERAE